MPHSVEMPAPVNGKITLASRIIAARSAVALSRSGTTILSTFMALS
jgi:hypothetical protein